MTYEQLRAAIIGRMMAFAGIEQARIDYQARRRFVMPEDGLWCRLSIETARPIVRGLCLPQVRIPGHVVIQCFDRAVSQTPTQALVALVDGLAAHFQFWSAPGLQCREAQMVVMGQSGAFCQTNVQVYFLTE